jgi:hypothetical protein
LHLQSILGVVDLKDEITRGLGRRRSSVCSDNDPAYCPCESGRAGTGLSANKGKVGRGIGNPRGEEKEVDS